MISPINFSRSVPLFIGEQNQFMIFNISKIDREANKRNAKNTNRQRVPRFFICVYKRMVRGMILLNRQFCNMLRRTNRNACTDKTF